MTAASSGAKGALGDAVRAFNALQPKDLATRSRLAQLLGLSLRPPEAPAAAPTAPISTPPVDQRPEPEIQYPFNPPNRFEPPPGPSLSAPQVVTPVPRPTPGAPLPDAVNYDFELQWQPPVRPRKARLPLLIPRAQRAILGELLARRLPIGDLDIDAIVAELARARVLLRFPRRLRRSIHGRVDLLVDLGESMEPFRYDQVQLSTALRKLIGFHRVRVGSFRDFPQFGVRQGTAPIGAFVPTPARAVLLLAAPGNERSSVPPDKARGLWQQFFSNVATAKGDTAVLSPISLAPWAAGLARQATIVRWDRNTGIGGVRDARRKRVRP